MDISNLFKTIFDTLKGKFLDLFIVLALNNLSDQQIVEIIDNACGPIVEAAGKAGLEHGTKITDKFHDSLPAYEAIEDKFQVAITAVRMNVDRIQGAYHQNFFDGLNHDDNL
jgi:hypothetical protein